MRGGGGGSPVAAVAAGAGEPRARHHKVLEPGLGASTGTRTRKGETRGTSEPMPCKRPCLVSDATTAASNGGPADLASQLQTWQCRRRRQQQQRARESFFFSPARTTEMPPPRDKTAGQDGGRKEAGRRQEEAAKEHTDATWMSKAQRTARRDRMLRGSLPGQMTMAASPANCPREEEGPRAPSPGRVPWHTPA